MKKNAIISLAMLYALWQTKRSDLLDLIRPFVLYAVGVTTKVGDIIDVEGICRYMESEFGYQSFQCAVVERILLRETSDAIKQESRIIKKEDRKFILIASLSTQVEKFNCSFAKNILTRLLRRWLAILTITVHADVTTIPLQRRKFSCCRFLSVRVDL